MKRFLRLALIFLFLISITGCDVVKMVDELRGDPSASANSAVLFYDEFSSAFSGWDSATGDAGETSYVTGGYLIWVKQPNLDLWANPGMDLEDVSIEVDAARVDGPLNNTFGILCRYQDVDNYYFGIVGSDGYFGIGKRIGGQNSLLMSDHLQPTDRVAGGSIVNHLRFDCTGSSLAIYANGYLLMQADDNELSHGDVGVIAGTLDEPGVVVTFDNFAVFKP